MSVLGSSRHARRAVAGAAVALFMVGSGAAFGMSGPHRPAADHHRRGGAARAAGPVGSGPRSTTSATSPAPPGPSGSVAGTAATSPAGGPATLPPERAAGPSVAGSATVSPAQAATSPAAWPEASASAISSAPEPAGTAPAVTGAGVPVPGTYTYDTAGSQQISLLTSSSYPARTPIVVAADGCGVSSTWKPSQGSSETVVECPAPGGVRVVSESSTITASGYSTTQTFACDPNAFIPVTTGQVGQTWTWECRAANEETSTQVVKLLGPRTAVVGGIPVSATEVSIAATLSGAEQGTMDNDYWLTSNAIPVRQSGTLHVSVGALTYSSNYNLHLVSLTPAR